MNRKMQALVYEGPRELNMHRVPVPSEGDDEVLVEVKYTGICVSELSGYLGPQFAAQTAPLVMGHEFSGIIAKVGPNVPAKIHIGQRVTANPLISCERCEKCLSGGHQLCEHRVLLGAGKPGSFAHSWRCGEKRVRLPDHVSLEDGAMTESLACAVRVSELANPAPAATIGHGLP